MKSNKPRQHPQQKKSMSQVFLNTDWPCLKTAEMIKALGVKSVLEIGPGAGVLTKPLIEAGLAVSAVEKDPRFAELLKINFIKDIDQGKLNIILDDILEFPLLDWIEKAEKPLAICGNIPYHISSSIIFALLPHMPSVEGVFLLVQLEFAQRLASAPCSKNYGSLSVFTQLRAKAALEFKVEKQCFTPIPKVDSALVSLRPLDELLPDTLLAKVEKLTRRAFAQRRKKLSNSLAPILSPESLAACSLDLNRRPDHLSPEEFVLLTKTILK